MDTPAVFKKLLKDEFLKLQFPPKNRPGLPVRYTQTGRSNPAEKGRGNLPFLKELAKKNFRQKT